MTNDADIERAKTAKDRHVKELMGKANVVAVGVGFGEPGSRLADRICIVVSVRRKVSRNQLNPQDIVPDEIDGIPVEVKVTGELRAF